MTFGEANRVLAVDDDAATLAFVSGVLERDGFLVDTACDGMDAIRKLGVHDYAAVVLDILMPRLDGFGVLSYITDRDPSLRQRIIVATALGDPKLGAPKIEGGGHAAAGVQFRGAIHHRLQILRQRLRLRIRRLLQSKDGRVDRGTKPTKFG